MPWEESDLRKEWQQREARLEQEREDLINDNREMWTQATRIYKASLDLGLGSDIAWDFVLDYCRSQKDEMTGFHTEPTAEDRRWMEDKVAQIKMRWSDFESQQKETK